MKLLYIVWSVEWICRLIASLFLMCWHITESGVLHLIHRDILWIAAQTEILAGDIHSRTDRMPRSRNRRSTYKDSVILMLVILHWDVFGGNRN